MGDSPSPLVLALTPRLKEETRIICSRKAIKESKRESMESQKMQYYAELSTNCNKYNSGLQSQELSPVQDKKEKTFL